MCCGFRVEVSLLVSFNVMRNLASEALPLHCFLSRKRVETKKYAPYLQHEPTEMVVCTDSTNRTFIALIL